MRHTDIHVRGRHPRGCREGAHGTRHLRRRTRAGRGRGARVIWRRAPRARARPIRRGRPRKTGTPGRLRAAQREMVVTRGHGHGRRATGRCVRELSNFHRPRKAPLTGGAEKQGTTATEINAATVVMAGRGSSQALWLVALHCCSGGWLASAYVLPGRGQLAAWGCLPALGGLFVSRERDEDLAAGDLAYSHSHTKWCGCSAAKEQKDAHTDNHMHAPTTASRLVDTEASRQMSASRQEKLLAEEVEVHQGSACAWCRSEPIFGMSVCSAKHSAVAAFAVLGAPLHTPIPHTPRLTSHVSKQELNGAAVFVLETRVSAGTATQVS